MSTKIYRKEITLPDGRIISIETGKLAKQADGSAVIQMGNAMLLATVVSARTASPVDFLPLTVDYREKFAAAGKFPGGFFKREARPSNDEILTMRLVDRVLRPLFPKDYHHETQVMIQLMSHDDEVMPDSLAGLAASTVIQLSDIPFEYPISEVRVARIDGNTKVFGVTELISENDFFDYEAKYNGKSLEITPAKIDKNLEELIHENSKTIYNKLKLNGFSRIDYIVKNDTPFFLEVSTIPGMTDESIFPKQVKLNNINLKDLCNNLPNEVYKYMTYCKNLTFYQQPNYEYLRNLFYRLLIKKGYKV